MAARSLERKKFLHDIFVTALEGGIGYWSTCTHYHWFKAGTGPDSFEGRIDDIEGFHATVITDGSEKDSTDSSEEGSQVYTVDIEVIARGINRICNGTATFGTRPLSPGPNSFQSRMIEANRELDSSNIDAGDADSIVQAGLWGDVIYG